MGTLNNTTKYAFGKLDQALVLQDESPSFRVSEKELEFLTKAYGRTIHWLLSLGVIFMGTTCVSLFA